MAVRLAGIQPGYLPWLGYFDQMRRVDVFVIADEMPYSSSGWAHRNRVRGPHGPVWLTLPARPTAGQRIADVALDPAVPWSRKHLRTIRHGYGRSPHAGELLPALEAAFDPSATRLTEASMPLVSFLAARFGIATPVVVSSAEQLERRYREAFPESPGASHRIIAFMKALGATELLEGESGRAYIDLELFAAHGLRVEFQRFDHPRYPQMHEPFVSHLSALDLLLCVGEAEARRVLASVAA